jgi:hypothetical protein
VGQGLTGGGGASGVGSGTVPLIIAGGGGARFTGSTYSGINAVTGTSGVAGEGLQSGFPGAPGGASGSDGAGCIYDTVNYSTGGRGWTASMPFGSIGQASYAYGSYIGAGSFGIGGGGSAAMYTGCWDVQCSPMCCWWSGEPGGGGYSGGGAGNLSGSGGGGGSYNAGTNQNNTAGANTGNGLIIIKYLNGPPALAITAGTTNICLGKTVTLTASGAVSYTWTGGISNGVPFTPTATATYSVTGTNSCGNTKASITITVTPVPVTASANPPVICMGKPTILNAVASAANFSWQPTGQYTPSISVSPSVNTTYSVTVSSASCIGFATVAVIVNANPTVIVSATPPTVCAGSPVTLSAGSNGSLVWSHGGLTTGNVIFTPIVSTSYSVTATNTSGCSTGTAVAVTVKAIPTVSVKADNIIVCPGETVSITATGNSFSYLWSTGQVSPGIIVKPMTNAVYTTTGTLDGCNATATIQVNVYPAPQVSITAPSTVICTHETITLAAAGAINYEWDNDVTGTFYSFSSFVPDTYTTVVTGTDKNGCMDTASIVVQVDACTGINENLYAVVKVFPNPSDKRITVTSDKPVSLTLLNQMGQALQTLDLAASNGYSATVSHLPTGVYFLISQEQHYSRKIIIR